MAGHRSLKHCRESSPGNNAPNEAQPNKCNHSDNKDGLDTGYTDDVAWIHDGAAVDDEVSAKLEQAYWDDEDTCKIDDDLEINLDDCERVGVYKYWEFMQPFFTHEAAQAFIDCHGEKYDGELRIMVDSAYRNPEWQFIRKMFMEEEGATK